MKDEADTATLDLEHDILGMHRRNDHLTSVQAAGRVRRFTLREIVLDLGEQMGREGLTDDDLKAWFPAKPESSLRKRRTELTQEYYLLNSGRTHKNRHGQDEIVWVHRDFHPNPPPIIERDTTPKQSEIVRLKAQVEEAGDLIQQLLNYAAIVSAREAAQQAAMERTDSPAGDACRRAANFLARINSN